MASVLIKNLPDELHRALKLRAECHHRSLNKELIAIIEATIHRPERAGLPEPVRLRKPLSQDILDEARDEGRA